MAVQKWKITGPYLTVPCELGEAPFHEVNTNTLRFVDIKKHRLHTFSLDKGPISLKTRQLGMPVGVTADIEGVDSQRRILLGGKKGLAVFERDSGSWEYLNMFYDSMERAERSRSNDGTVDSKGRLWIGTMNDFHVGTPQPEGSLFRFDSDLSRHLIKDGLSIPNGISWSKDDKTMYFVSSTDKNILAFDFDSATGNVSNERVFWTLEGEGDPDGHVPDSEGYLWQCIYGQGRVVRIATSGEDAGKIVGEVSVPTRCVTCPTFVGNELWITSAVEEDPEKYPESAKFGGALFKIDVGIGGLPKHKFKMDKAILDSLRG